MRVSIRLGAPLSQVVGERKISVTLPDGATAADLLAELTLRYPNFEAGLKGQGLSKPWDQILYCLFLNARPVAFDRARATPLRDGDQVSLFLPVAGG
jgi:molybdopterin converting factor small subunit